MTEAHVMVYKSKVKVAKFILSIKINVQTNVNDTSFILTNTYITTLEKHFVSGSVRLYFIPIFLQQLVMLRPKNHSPKEVGQQFAKDHGTNY